MRIQKVKIQARTLRLGALVLLLGAAIACGAAAPAEEPTTAPTAAPAAEPTAAPMAEATPTAAPVAEPTPTPALPEAVQPAGTLNVGQKELGDLFGHPKEAVNPGLFVSQTPPLGEGLIFSNLDREFEGWLLESWSISEDFTTWTLKLRQGVQFHQGYGEMTAEDVVWSYREGWAENDKHVRFSDFSDFWQHPDGYVETPDDYTVVVNTGLAIPETIVMGWMNAPGGTSNWVASKSQSEEVGVEAANVDPALTGPWKFVEQRQAEFWRMEAVEDHWRQTPHFAELVFWEIPEESSRMAGLQTGQLDTSLMAFDSIPLVEEMPGFKLMSIPEAVDYGLNIYGGYYAEAADPELESWPAYDPEAPFISGNMDVNSAEWERAAKVRRALSIAVDRKTIIETILRGFARPGILWGFAPREELLEGLRWEYNPDQARELLAEAGYADGFSITLTPSLRGAPAEVEACEAIAQMWGNIGIDVNFQNIPYGTLRPQLVGRTYQGATCHASSVQPDVPPLTSITTRASWNAGATHPWLEEMIWKADRSVDPAERSQALGEIGAFLFDSAISRLSLYVVDAVWPVGPQIEEWREDVKTRDLRNINGYEYIRPRK